MSMNNIVTTETIEELEYEIRKAEIAPKRADLEKFFSGLRELSQKYAQGVYDKIGRLDLPRDEIEGSGTTPGFGHIVWATALITAAWTAWLFPDKALRRFDKETSEKYAHFVANSIDDAIQTGSTYVGKERAPISAPCKWLEVNIHLKDYSVTDAVLKEFVAPYTQACKAKGAIYSWHFFREPEIRLRFYGKETDIDEIRQDLDSRLSQLETDQPGVFEKHIFGAHGREGEQYQGEEDMWGSDWPIAMKFYEYGSETACQFLVAERSDKSLDYHADRYVHLLLNQLGYTRLHELLFHHQKTGGYFVEFLSWLLRETGEIKNKLAEIENKIS